MVKLPPQTNPTADAIFRRHEHEAEDWRRPHLGASVIGDEKCLRQLWYIFRWASSPNFEGRLLRLFERGQREEDWIVEELKALGWKVEENDPETGEQRRVSFLGGHFGGSSDGQVLGVFESPKTWHLLEVKTSNKKRFDQLQKEGVRKSQAGHYAQMQVYMHGLKLKRALYVCVCKDDDRIYTERVYYSKEYAEATLQRAESVIRSRNPPTKISGDPSWFECKLCDYRSICHMGGVEYLERNCRTCASSTPRDDGSWECEHRQKQLSVEDQRQGCGDHLFIPEILPWDMIGYHPESRRVVYDAGGMKITDCERELTPWVEG